jgi:flavin reductase ActVB
MGDLLRVPADISPTAPPLAFREGLSRFASGVTVATTRDGDGRRFGFTASSFASVSLQPPLVLVCLARSARCSGAFTQSSRFVVSVLSADQTDIAMRFGSSGVGDKFQGLRMCRGHETDLPLVPDAVAHLECATAEVVPAGDHDILIGRVLTARVRDGDPLIIHRRSMGTFTPGPVGR